MQLDITRSQKKAGMVTKTVVFVLEVQSHLSQEETHLIKEYGLGKDVIYNSEGARKHLDNAASGGLMGAMKGLALASLSLRITIDSLISGHTIECKTLDEVLSAEDAVRDACANMKTYLEVAQKFDGTKESIEF